jgi:hypothetical protein
MKYIPFTQVFAHFQSGIDRNLFVRERIGLYATKLVCTQQNWFVRGRIGLYAKELVCTRKKLVCTWKNWFVRGRLGSYAKEFACTRKNWVAHGKTDLYAEEIGVYAKEFVCTSTINLYYTFAKRPYTTDLLRPTVFEPRILDSLVLGGL